VVSHAPRKHGRTLTSGSQGERTAAAAGCRRQRKVRAAQSEGARRKPGRRVRASTVQIGAPSDRRESNRDDSRLQGRGEKGNPPRSNLRLDRLQVARRGRKSRAAHGSVRRPVGPGPKAERDGRRQQNSAYVSPRSHVNHHRARCL
jgi:hypothetical protein